MTRDDVFGLGHAWNSRGGALGCWAVCERKRESAGRSLVVGSCARVAAVGAEGREGMLLGGAADFWRERWRAGQKLAEPMNADGGEEEGPLYAVQDALGRGMPGTPLLIDGGGLLNMASMSQIRIHTAAYVDSSAELGEGCEIAAGAVIGPRVRLGAGCQIGPSTVLEGGPEGGAELGPDCVLGSHCIVGPRVRIGRANRLVAQVALLGRTMLGHENQLFPGVVLGGPPQDLYNPGSDTELRVGDRNVFREHVTINVGTPKENSCTVVGSRNLLMAGAHLGHDCIVEDDVVITNACLFAGHCKIERGTVVGGGCCFSPYVTVGRYSHVGGSCSSFCDIPPYLVVAGGYKATVQGVNTIGLRRAGFSAEAIAALRTACQRLYTARKGLFVEALAGLERDGPHTPEVEYLCQSLRASMAGRVMRAREVLRGRPPHGPVTPLSS